MESSDGMDEDQLEDLYNWVDEIPLSRPKKSIARDFADGEKSQNLANRTRSLCRRSTNSAIHKANGSLVTGRSLQNGKMSMGNRHTEQSPEVVLYGGRQSGGFVNRAVSVVLAAEIVKHFCPRLVELHNYSSAHARAKKVENWDLLNRKVFKKLGFELAEDVLYNVINAQPFAIEKVLVLLRRKIDRYMYEQKRHKEHEDKQKNPAPAFAAAKKGKDAVLVSKNRGGNLSDRPEADQNVTAYPTDTQYTGEMVSKLTVEEREQELLAKEETIQILNAKIRRLEHLVHLKDIRIDDLSNMIKELEDNMRRQKMVAAKHP